MVFAQPGGHLSSSKTEEYRERAIQSGASRRVIDCGAPECGLSQRSSNTYGSMIFTVGKYEV
jgi:hypothetical protein